MIRNLKALGLALVAVFAMSAVASPAASASPALFTAAGVVAPEKAGITGGQITPPGDNFVIGVLPVITCMLLTLSGEAITAGPSTTYVKLTPNYDTCHVVAPLFGTRTVTITMNGCSYTFNATKGTNSAAAPTPGIATPFSADLHITCPVGNQIEIHTYNTASHNDAGSATLCKYDIGPQTILDQTQGTNTGTGDIILDIHAKVATTNTMLGGICSSASNPNAAYKAGHTVTATNGGVSVNFSLS